MNRHLIILIFWASMQLCLVPTRAKGETYDLSKVNGMEAFQGSDAAKELLRKNGFVVAGPAFRQIFEPYIFGSQSREDPETELPGKRLPSFITTDSAWHTYHVLLEEGVMEMEQVQRRRLIEFSRQLLAASVDQKLGPAARDVNLLASVGLALQDEEYRKTLGGKVKRLVARLRSGSGEVEVPVGFPLSAVQFHAQSFYSQSPELSDYFAARQWYGSVVFRLTISAETHSAIALARLLESHPELLKLWKQLSDPIDEFLAPAEDGTIKEYSAAANSVLGTNSIGSPISENQFSEIQKRLESQLALPRINDQLLSPEQYARHGKETRGFRLMPPRRLPCSVCFQNTIDPIIPGRTYPSGLDFMSASRVMRSPAAMSAVEARIGKHISDLILKTDCGPLPDSLYGDSMRLLASLQKPLPSTVPVCMQSEAWADLQLWTQLGAWAEQRHTWALHSKLSAGLHGTADVPIGTVAPYPEFFSGLAMLSRKTAEAFEKAGVEPQFEVKAVAAQLLEYLKMCYGKYTAADWKKHENYLSNQKQLSDFMDYYYHKHEAELLMGDGSRRLYDMMMELARRCLETGTANDSDLESLKYFFESRRQITPMVKEFAGLCEGLAKIAEKTQAGKDLSAVEEIWIREYGLRLAGFHFYQREAFLIPKDDFPLVTRIYSSPTDSAMLYAGLGRPRSLYVIISDGKTQQLYRGAVMTYREFIRPNSQLLDDESWRELVVKGQAPTPPKFTRSFYAK